MKNAATSPKEKAHSNKRSKPTTEANVGGEKIEDENNPSKRLSVGHVGIFSHSSSLPEKSDNNSSISSPDSSDGPQERETSLTSSPHSSDIEIESSKISKIIVNHRLDPITLKLIFLFNIGQRFDTWLKDSQGDHVTSYNTILSVFLTSTDSTVLSMAIKGICELAEKLLDDKPLAEFYQINNPETVKRKVRKEIRELIEKSDISITGDTKQTDLVYSALKAQSISLKADYLAKITTFLLENLQQNNLITAFSRGRIDKKPDEGNLVKRSSRALTALNRLCYFCQLNVALLL